MKAFMVFLFSFHFGTIERKTQRFMGDDTSMQRSHFKIIASPMFITSLFGGTWQKEGILIERATRADVQIPHAKISESKLHS